MLLLLRNLTYRNSDADTANAEKSITQCCIQCRDFSQVASSKTEMVHVDKLTAKRGQYALFLQTVGPVDLLKWNIWSGDPTTPGREPGCKRKFMQSANTTLRKLRTILCPGYIKIISTSTSIPKYYPSKRFNKISYKSLANVHSVLLWLLTKRIALETCGLQLDLNSEPLSS